MSLESLNGFEYLANFLKFRIHGFKEKADGNFYYQLQAIFSMEDPPRKQDIECTFAICHQLQSALKQQCPDIPQLPAANIFGFKPSIQEVEKRKIEMEKWLNAIVWRCDVLSTKQFQKFCKSWIDPPQASLKLNQEHLFPIQDFHYEVDTQVCFALTSDDSVASKMSGFVNIFTGINKQGPVRSQLIAYRLDVDEQGSPIAKQLWKQSYSYKGTVICWNEELELLAIGFENGNIICLRITAKSNYKEQLEYCSYQKHSSTIRGIVISKANGFLYSISKDRSLITTDLANPNNILKGISGNQKEFPQELTCLVAQQDCVRIFVGDVVGSVYIFNTEQGILQAVYSIKPDAKICISSIQFLPQRDFLIVGSQQGIVMVFELGKPGKEKLTQLISQIETVPNQRSLVFSVSTKELFVNYNANILIVDSSKVKYLFSLEAHNDSVTKIQLHEDVGLLITGGKDKSLKFWQYKYFPHTQLNIELLPYRTGNIQQKEILSNQIPDKLQQEEKKIVLKHELESLDGWT